MKSRKLLLIGGVLLTLILVLVVIVALQPAKFSVSRSATIAAPPELVFAQVNDFRRWDAWSPWAKLDPAMKTSFSGPESGAGAVYEWQGNDDVGEGRMTLTTSTPSTHIRIKLEFIKPFPATNDTEFTFTGDGQVTLVAWTMSGEHNFMGKAFCLVMNMDKMVGGDFEKGLAQLKAVVEAQLAPPAVPAVPAAPVVPVAPVAPPAP